MAEETTAPNSFYTDNAEDESIDCPQCFYDEGLAAAEEEAAKEQADDNNCPGCFYTEG